MKIAKVLKVLCVGGVAALLAALDNTIKENVENGTIEDGESALGGFAEIEKHHNKGLPMNKLDKHTKEITGVSSGVMVFQALTTLYDALEKDDAVNDAANALIMAGALSNTRDRIERGYVVDYLKVGKKRAIYNISDFFIITGVIIKAIKSIFD